MITDKILIFFTDLLNVNLGGPQGFLAQNLVTDPMDFYVFPFQLFSEKRFKTQVNWFAYKHLHKDANQIRFIFDEIGAKNFKYIYFHDCETFGHCKDLIGARQIVILQSHSPELPSSEARNAGRTKSTVDFLMKAENESFERANIIVFPNEQCVPLYEGIEFDHSKIKYILSGSLEINDIRPYPLDNSKINLLYMGRRIEIKGFDIVLQSFKNALNTRNDLNLIIAGNGPKITGRNIYDIGSTLSPLNWYSSVDYVINANRKSYFDLSVMEALSTGARIILSNNFGHKYYVGKSPDILTFENGLKGELENILIKKVGKTYEPSKPNIELHKAELSSTQYKKRFEDFFLGIK